MDRNQGLIELISHKNMLFYQASFCPAIQKMSSEWMNPSCPIKQWFPIQECQIMPGNSKYALSFFWNCHQVNNSHASSKKRTFLTGFKTNRKTLSVCGQYFPGLSLSSDAQAEQGGCRHLQRWSSTDTFLASPHKRLSHSSFSGWGHWSTACPRQTWPGHGLL